MIDLVSPDFWPIVPLVPHWGHIPFHLEVYRSSWTCAIIITYWMLTETWTWSLPYHDSLVEPPESHPARPALLGTWMPCLSIWEVHLGYMCMIQLWIRTTSTTCSMIDDFMSFVIWTCRAPDAILGHIFHFRWDLWFFTDVACSMIDDFMMPDLRPIICSTPY